MLVMSCLVWSGFGFARARSRGLGWPIFWPAMRQGQSGGDFRTAPLDNYSKRRLLPAVAVAVPLDLRLPVAIEQQPDGSLASLRSCSQKPATTTIARQRKWPLTLLGSRCDGDGDADKSVGRKRRQQQQQSALLFAASSRRQQLSGAICCARARTRSALGTQARGRALRQLRVFVRAARRLQ